jgi:hypothetical protein
VLNRFLLPRTWRLNGLNPDLMPHITPDLAQRIDLDVLGQFVLALSQAGMPLFPDPDLEDWIRDTAGMPERPDDFPDVGESMPGAPLPPDQQRAAHTPLPDASHPDALAATMGAMDTAAVKKLLRESIARRVKRRR